MSSPSDNSPSDRRDEIAANLDALRKRLQAACAAAGRSADDVTVVAVTKTFPASDVRLLTELGVTDIGENRDQEARRKAQACADLSIRWHFVGQLQTNKARSVARYADVVHSVDRPRLVTALADAAVAAGRSLRCLVQVDLDPERHAETHRGGSVPTDVRAVTEALVAAEGVSLDGVMAVAPLGADPWQASARLADVAAAVRAEHPQARIVSAGMTADLEAAVGCGATHVRVGSALLGARPSLR